MLRLRRVEKVQMQQSRVWACRNTEYGSKECTGKQCGTSRAACAERRKHRVASTVVMSSESQSGLIKGREVCGRWELAWILPPIPCLAA